MGSTIQMKRPQSSIELASIEQLKEAWLRANLIEFGDPVLARTSLLYRETYFPLGFPVKIAANSLEVLEAAHQSWGRFTCLFDTEPVWIQVTVTVGDSNICPPTPVCRMRDHISTNVADAEDFATCDFSLGSAMIWVTDAALRNRDYFRYFFLESAALSNISNRFVTGIHASCVALHGFGVLLCGDSGAGKSTLSYACARAGWTYVTDDGSYLVHGRRDRLVVGDYSKVRFRPTAEELFPELHRLPVMQRAGVGKPSVEMPTNLSSTIRTASTANVRHIVFLKRNVPTQELVAFPRSVARLYMQQRIQCMPYRTDVHLEAVEQLLELGAYELRYNDLDWAVDRLTGFVQEGQ
jgi:hypothetical protein